MKKTESAVKSEKAVKKTAAPKKATKTVAQKPSVIEDDGSDVDILNKPKSEAQPLSKKDVKEKAIRAAEAKFGKLVLEQIKKGNLNPFRAELENVPFLRLMQLEKKWGVWISWTGKFAYIDLTKLNKKLDSETTRSLLLETTAGVELRPMIRVFHDIWLKEEKNSRLKKLADEVVDAEKEIQKQITVAFEAGEFMLGFRLEGKGVLVSALVSERFRVRKFKVYEDYQDTESPFISIHWS